MPWRMFFWRTSHGAEVDVVLECPGERLYGIEIKSSADVSPKECSGLKRFREAFLAATLICITTGGHPYERGDVVFMPWHHFFKDELKLV